MEKIVDAVLILCPKCMESTIVPAEPGKYVLHNCEVANDLLLIDKAARERMQARFNFVPLRQIETVS